MDDLLALMGSAENDANFNDSAGNNLDLFDLEESTHKEDSSSYKGKSSTSIEITQRSSNTSLQNSKESVKKQNSNSNQVNKAAGTIDPLTKIRIVQRQTSKVDLIDLLAPFQFQTTAVLASMSKPQLSTLITHPSNNDEFAGRSNMATMGIVFSNSGTRISKNGRAFSIMTLGDLHTGPTVSIFFFGHAYSKFTTLIKPGSVLAVVGSSIMPAKSGGETRISLSVNDIQQLIQVGKAMDYGICPAVNKRKSQSSHGNGYQMIETKCKNYVDLRLCRYCKYHSRQQEQNQQNYSGKKSGVAKNMTFVQSMRAENQMKNRAMASMKQMGNMNSSQSASNGMMTMFMPGQGKIVTHAGNKNSNVLPNHGMNRQTMSKTLNQRGGFGGSNALEEALAMSNANLELQMAPSQHLPPVERNLQRAPKHMMLSSTPSLSRKGHNHNNRQLGATMSKSGVQNPYARKHTTVSVQANSSAASNSGVRASSVQTDLLGQALGTCGPYATGRKRSTHTPLTKKETKASGEKRKRNLVHMEGMNGQVQVPKPNALFRRTVVPTQNTTPYINQLQPITPSPKQKSTMLEKQREAAERLKSRTLTSTLQSRSKPKAKQQEASTNLDDILGSAPLSDEKRSSILAAESKYSRQANAEAYAKGRQAVCELEKQETAHDKRQKKSTSKSKGGDVGSAIIVSEFKCLTCNKITSFKPTRCFNANHKVKRKRQIKKAVSVDQKRLNLNARAAKDGGLVLGAGLEWSGFNRS